jgi:phage baseplate assembly protein W
VGYVHSWRPRISRLDWSTAVKAIKHPFTLDVFGKTNYTATSAKLYLDRVLTLLSTQIGQRPMNPEYGTDLGSALFENEGNFIVAVEVAIRSAVSRWIPQVTVSSVSVINFSDDGYANVQVQVTLPNNQGISLTVNSSVFGSNGAVSRGEQ